MGVWIYGCTHTSQFEPCPSAFDHQSAVPLTSVSARLAGPGPLGRDGPEHGSVGLSRVTVLQRSKTNMAVKGLLWSTAEVQNA